MFTDHCAADSKLVVRRVETERSYHRANGMHISNQRMIVLNHHLT